MEGAYGPMVALGGVRWWRVCGREAGLVLVLWRCNSVCVWGGASWRRCCIAPCACGDPSWPHGVKGTAACLEPSFTLHPLPRLNPNIQDFVLFLYSTMTRTISEIMSEAGSAEDWGGGTALPDSVLSRASATLQNLSQVAHSEQEVGGRAGAAYGSAPLPAKVAMIVLSWQRRQGRARMAVPLTSGRPWPLPLAHLPPLVADPASCCSLPPGLAAVCGRLPC